MLYRFTFKNVDENFMNTFQVTKACKTHGGFYLGSIGGPAAILAQNCIKKVEVLEYPELGMYIGGFQVCNRMPNCADERPEFSPLAWNSSLMDFQEHHCREILFRCHVK